MAKRKDTTAKIENDDVITKETDTKLAPKTAAELSKLESATTAKPTPKPAAKPAAKKPVPMLTFNTWFGTSGRPGHHKPPMETWLKKRGGTAKRRTKEQWDALFAAY